jgi:hypothetical protein
VLAGPRVAAPRDLRLVGVDGVRVETALGGLGDRSLGADEEDAEAVSVALDAAVLDLLEVRGEHRRIERRVRAAERDAAAELAEPAVLADTVRVAVDARRRLQLRLRRDDVPQPGDGHQLVLPDLRRRVVAAAAAVGVVAVVPACGNRGEKEREE